MTTSEIASDRELELLRKIERLATDRADLLAALKAVVESHGGLCVSPSMKAAVAAIAKAERSK